MLVDHAITVIDGYPAKYVVSVSDNRGTYEPRGLILLIYEFSCQNADDGPSALDFIVLVSRDMALVTQNGDVFKETHQKAITFGLLSKQRAPDENEFLLTTDSWKSLSTESKMNGAELRKAILRLFRAVNREWPEYGIGLPDLVDNFVASEDQFRGWDTQLEQAGFLRRKRGFKTFREHRDQVRMKTYVLDQSNLERIAKELGTAGMNESKRNDTGPYDHYKIISIDPDSLPGGFVFVMTQFDDEHEEVVNNIVKPVCKESCGLQAVMSKEDNLPYSLTDKVISHIHKCRFAIADITVQNPNVMYEIGFAHAIKKSVIIIANEAEKKSKNVFDVRDIHTIFYTSRSDLEQRLGAAITSVNGLHNG